MRKLMMLVVVLVLATGVLPTASAQCENCPTPTAPQAGNSCPEPLVTVEKPAQSIGTFALTDNNTMIYTVQKEQGADIYGLSLVNHTPPQPLCTDCSPMWVETGVLVYIGYDRKLYRVPLGGGEATRLDYYPAEDALLNTASTPDGQYQVSLVRSHADNRMTLYRADIAGGNVTLINDTFILYPNQGGNTHFQIADDGSLVFIGMDAARTLHLYAQRMDGSEAILLSGELPIRGEYRLGGEYVYFTTHDEQQLSVSLYRTRLDGTDLTLLTGIQDPSIGGYRISPDGQTFAYLDGQSLYVIRDADVPIQLFDFIDQSRPEWEFTPDNQAILALQWGSIYRVSLAGGEPQLLTSQLIGNGTSLRPNYIGDWIIQSSYQHGAEIIEYFLIPADGVGPMVKFASSDLFGGWGPSYLIEGDRLIYEVGGAGASALYTATPDELGPLGQQAQMVGCTFVEGAIGLIGVYDHRLVYVGYTQAADLIYAVPFQP